MDGQPQTTDDLVDCPQCRGSGFSGYGSGYDAVCGECGGQRQLPRETAEPGSPEDQIRRLKSLLQDVLDDMMFSVAPNKGTLTKIEEALRGR